MGRGFSHRKLIEKLCRLLSKPGFRHDRWVMTQRAVHRSNSFTSVFPVTENLIYFFGLYLWVAWPKMLSAASMIVSDSVG